MPLLSGTLLPSEFKMMEAWVDNYHLIVTAAEALTSAQYLATYLEGALSRCKSCMHVSVPSSQSLILSRNLLYFPLILRGVLLVTLDSLCTLDCLLASLEKLQLGNNCNHVSFVFLWFGS